MLLRRLHRSAGPRRAADWPPPLSHPASRSTVPLPRSRVMCLLVPSLLGLLMLASTSAAQPRLLGCRLASEDQLLHWEAFSSPSGHAGCTELCGQQQALLAVTSSSRCFCLNQPASAAELTADCSQTAPPGLELQHFYSLVEPVTVTGDSSGTSSASGGSLVSELGVPQPQLIRCALASDEMSGTTRTVDMCVHICGTSNSDGFMALGPDNDAIEEYECFCSAADEFGASLDGSECDQACSRHGEELHDTTCGGETSDGSTALSVYRLVDDNPGSTPTPVTTGRSTGHSASVSGITDSACPDNGVQVDGGSCYLPASINADKPVYQDVIDACTGFRSGSAWRPWAIETKDERDKVFETLLIGEGFFQDQDDYVATSGTVQSDGTTVEWADWPSDGPADWLNGFTTGTPQQGDVLVWCNIHTTLEATTLKYFDPTGLPNRLATLCELSMAGTTVTTTESTTTSPTTTAPTSTTTSPTTTAPASTTTSPASTATESTTTSPSTTVRTSTTMESTSSPTSTALPPTPDPSPKPATPDDIINDLFDDLNKTTSSNITDTDVIDTVDQLDDLLDAQMNMSSGLPPDERLANDTQFTKDFVQLVDTLLSASDAWSNMTQSQSAETSDKLMDSTEAVGFLLANSTAVAGFDDPIETAQPSLIMSSSSVERNYNGGLVFPLYEDSSSWIRLPKGYASQVEQPGSDRLLQVGLLYRSEVMSLLLSPGNNSMDDPEKRLNSPVLSFSLGGVGQRVQLPGQGARMQLEYGLTEREPDQKDVWRHLHPNEEPSAVRGTAVCAYWNDTLSEWRKDGCWLEEGSSSKHHASCVCSHLTNFAILMDYHEYVGTPQSLSIMTWVLGCLSLIGLVITWIVFTCNRSLHCTRTTITRNLCATYAVGLTLLLTVMDRRLVYLKPAACTVVGMAIHYSFLAVFAWTMVEGIHLYKVLRHVFEPKSNSMTRYYMYGYLMPALILIVTTGVALGVDQYAYVRDEFCWLTIPYFIWFYNGPIAVVLIMNTFVLILAYRSAATLKVNQLRAKTEKMKRWLKGWFSLSCLLGIQWAIGYIYVDGSNVFDYVFTALNCSQGLLIFIFHCVLREKTRQILLGRFSTGKRSTMMNSVYGQMVIAERKTKEYRQSRMSHDTCVTTLSNTPSPANSDTPDSSPSSERSSSSSEGSSSGSKSSVRAGSRKGHSAVTRRGSADSKRTSSLRGRVNLAFQPDEPWAPLPDICEETDGPASPHHSAAPPPARASCSGRAFLLHQDSVEMYRSGMSGRSNSVAALRHGKAH